MISAGGGRGRRDPFVRLKPASGHAFHRLVVEESMPMLERWGVDVVAFGPSLDDDELYVLSLSATSR
jgi:hypothetical protein